MGSSRCEVADGRAFTGSATRFMAASLMVFVTALSCQSAVSAPVQERSNAAPPQKYSLRWTSDPSDTNKVFVEVSGLNAAALKQFQPTNGNPPPWPQLFAIYAEQGDLLADLGVPPMLGAYRVNSGTLRFEPQFPLEPGLSYRAVLHPGQLSGERDGRGEMSSVFKAPPRRSNPGTVVSQIYPSGGLLPENLLKFYVHFSAPMSRGQIYDHIHLRDAAGKDIDLPFLEIDEELWDPTMTRLTLFIDPGRIKRGVRPLEEIGPALETGKRFTLVIDSAWKDGAGSRLREAFEKTFQVGPPDRDPPDPRQWKIQPPKEDTREAITLTFPKPMDHALAQRVIRVTNSSGELLAGATALADQERRWTFTPERPWRRGPHQLVIQTTLEDLAGNNIGKPFEVDLIEPIQRRLDHSSVKLPFEVR